AKNPIGADGGEDYPKMVIDVINNKVYLAGVFTSDTLNFDDIELVNSGGSNIFIAKLDTDGTWEFATQVRGDNEMYFMYSEIKYDPTTDGVYIAGVFANSLTFGDYMVNSTGDVIGYLAKISANGEWV